MRETQVMVRMSDEEKGLVEMAAADLGLPIASWARMELLTAARSRLAPARPTNGTAQNSLGVVSLFCGPGGLDEGFRQAGFSTMVAIDSDPDCVKTFQYNHRTAKAATRSVVGLQPEHLDEVYGDRVQPVGVLGGPPCQSFSVSNVYQQENDPRHDLPAAYAELLRQLNARRAISFFVFENVPGLLSKRHRERYEQFKLMFTDAGFRIKEAELNAKDYGVPQDRPRIFIVGINQALHPDVEWSPPETQSGVVTVAQTIRGLPEPVHNARGLDPDTFPVHPNHWCLVPKSGKFERGLKEGEMWGRSFRTLQWDQPSWTVAYGNREVHVHPSGRRRLSMYEAMLLQSFPETYRLLGNITSQVKQVSDAVPPRLARRIAESIRAALSL